MVGIVTTALLSEIFSSSQSVKERNDRFFPLGRNSENQVLNVARRGGTTDEMKNVMMQYPKDIGFSMDECLERSDENENISEKFSCNDDR